MIKFKRFSIQSGKPGKSAGLLGEFGRKAKKYVPVGAAIGAGYGMIDEEDGVVKNAIKGAAIGVMIAALDTALSYFKRRDIKKATANEIISKLRTKAPITPNDYTVNSDPYSSKLSVAMGGGAMVMWINDLTPQQINIISEVLDEECRTNRYADYKSEPMTNGYLVTVLLSSMDNACEVLACMINELGIKINIVSELSQSNKTFSIKDKYNEYKEDKKGFIKSLLKRNRKVKQMENIHPGITDEVIDNLSVEPILDIIKDGESFVKRPEV